MNIFISYSRKNLKEMTHIVSDIEALGHTAWFDRELSGGQNWWDKILDNIISSDIFIFILSNDSLNSMACQSEYKYADSLTKPIIPLLIEKSVSVNLLPTELAKIQLIDYSTPDKHSGFELSKSLNRTILSTALPEPLPTPPAAPMSYLGKIVDEISFDKKLSLEEQSAILLQIKSSMVDGEGNIDEISLLEKIRKHPSLYASISNEVESMIENNNTRAIKLKNNNKPKSSEKKDYKKYIFILIGLAVLTFGAIKVIELANIQARQVKNAANQAEIEERISNMSPEQKRKYDATMDAIDKAAQRTIDKI